MKILVEHPISTPFTALNQGGTETFVKNVVGALLAVGHEVVVFASQDSTEPCIKASGSSMVFNNTKGKNTYYRPWYVDLSEASKSFDHVILNTTFDSNTLLDPAFEPLFSKSIYFNHIHSQWNTTGFAGQWMQVIIRYFRSVGGKAFYFSEKNRAIIERNWVRKEVRDHATTTKCKFGLERIGRSDFLFDAPFDGHFTQAVTAPTIARPAEGFLIAIGRPDKAKRLNRAGDLALSLGKQLVVYTHSNVPRADKKYAEKTIADLKACGAIVILDAPHEEIMSSLSMADCLLLSSKDETFSIVCFEALCRGVPVSFLECPPALELCAELAREWGDVVPNSFAEREELSTRVQQEYTLEALGRRLVNLF